MRLESFLVGLVVFFLLAQCRTKEEKKEDIADVKFIIPPSKGVLISNVVEYKQAASIYGEWRYLSESIMFFAGLTFNRDGTFEYFDQSCLGICLSEGNFQNFGTILILKSFDKYKSRNNAFDTTNLYFNNEIYQFMDGYLYGKYKNDFPDYVQTKYY